MIAVPLSKVRRFFDLFPLDLSKIAVNTAIWQHWATPGANAFTWGLKSDMVTLNDDIILNYAEIVPVNSRGHFGLKQEDLKLVSSWMVVVYISFFLLKDLGKLNFYFLFEIWHANKIYL
jgi:hypothetical protein